MATFFSRALAATLNASVSVLPLNPPSRRRVQLAAAGRDEQVQSPFGNILEKTNIQLARALLPIF